MDRKLVLIIPVLLLAFQLASATQIDVSSGSAHVIAYDEPHNVIGIFYQDTDLYFRTIGADSGEVGQAVKLANGVKPTAAVFANDKFYLVGEAPSGIEGFVVDASGTFQQFTVSTGTDTKASVAYNPDTNQIIVVWQRTSTRNIFSRVFDANTLTASQENDVTGNVAKFHQVSNQAINPTVSYDEDNKSYLVVFRGTHVGLASIDLNPADGTPNNLDPLSAIPEDDSPYMIYFNEEFFVVYESERLGFSKDVFLTTKNTVGTFDFQIATVPAVDELRPRISFNTFFDPVTGAINLENYGFVWYDSSGKVKLQITDDALNLITQPIALGSGQDPEIVFIEPESFFVSYLSGGIKGKFFDLSGNEKSKHGIGSLSTDQTTAGFNLVDKLNKPVTLADNFFNDKDIYFIDQNGDLRAKLRLLFSITDVDLSNLKIFLEPTKTVAVTGGVLGLEQEHALYLRNTNNGNGIRICPEAQKPEETGDLCGGEVYVTSSMMPYNFRGISADLITYSAKEYYEVDGLESSGIELLVSKFDLAVNDTTDFKNVSAGESIDLLVDYTENDLDIQNADCQVTFSTQPVGSSPSLDYNCQANKPCFHRTAFNFSQDGSYTYTVTCSAQGKPTLTQAKTIQVGQGQSGTAPTACIPNWICTDWSPEPCQPGQEQERICTDTNNCGALGKPPEKRDCSVSVCKEDWSCGNWGNCVNKEQKRQCIDRNNCGTEKNKPADKIACEFTQKGLEFNWLPIIIVVLAAAIIGLLAFYLYKRRVGSSPELEISYK